MCVFVCVVTNRVVVMKMIRRMCCCLFCFVLSFAGVCFVGATTLVHARSNSKEVGR